MPSSSQIAQPRVSQSAMAVARDREPDARTATAGSATRVSASEGDRSGEIATALVRLTRAVTGIRQRMAAGYEADRFPVFLLLKLAHHGPCRASDLAEMVCADPSTVSRQVATLVKAGHVVRQADPDDGRASILVPTGQGLARARDYTNRRGKALAVVLDGWSDDERAVFLRLVHQCADGIEAHREEILARFLESDVTGGDR